MEIVTNCPSCGARFKFTEKYFGRSVKCPKCSGAIAVPQPERSDEPQRCPSCGVPLEADAPLCPQCGYDLAMANLVDSAPATPKTSARAGAGRIGRRNRGRQSKLFGLVTVGAVGVALLAAGGFWVYWTTSQGTSAKAPETSPSVLVLDWPADERFTGAVALQPMPVARQTVGRGAKVGAFGFPITGAGGSGLKLTTGIVSAEPDPSTRGMLLLDCRINPGNSGGPLCDVRGNVVGVVTAKSIGGHGVESFGMALPAEVVHEFLAEKLPKGAKLAPAGRAKKTLEWDEIDGMVSASVLLIVQGQ